MKKTTTITTQLTLDSTSLRKYLPKRKDNNATIKLIQPTKDTSGHTSLNTNAQDTISPPSSIESVLANTKQGTYEKRKRIKIPTCSSNLEAKPMTKTQEQMDIDLDIAPPQTTPQKLQILT